MAQKYFRKAGVARLAAARPRGTACPPWLWRSEPDNEDAAHSTANGGETDARQVFHRLAGTWTYWGWKHGYFDTAEDAATFYDELCHMMATQKAAPNSPQWFNTGLHWAYGISRPRAGPLVRRPRLRRAARARPAPTSGRSRTPASSSRSSDDLVNEGGIMDLWTREARIFKYGSGTGSNFSRLRGEGERLSGGGKSSGLMSFLKIGDRAAGAIKSGGTTRRAAKMVIVDADHPDVEEFIDWKVNEEQKVAALVAGSKVIRRSPARHPRRRRRGRRGRPDPTRTARCAGPSRARAATACPRPTSSACCSSPRRASRRSTSPSSTRTGRARRTSPSPARTRTTPCASTHDFLDAVREDREWQLIRRTDGRRAQDAARARRCGTASRTPPGSPPTPACSTTPRSTSGTPRPRAAASTARTRAPSTCSSTTRRATSRR